MSDVLKNEYYRYEDWLELDDDVRAELVDGEMYLMAPPVQRHQEILMELSRQLANFLKGPLVQGKPSRVFPAPFGVRLSKTDDTVYEPDIVLVCDKTKLNGKICDGVPDLLVEITSPSSSRYDRLFKFNRYLRAGVREYWIVDDISETVQVNSLEDGKYTTAMYGSGDKIPVGALPGCEIDLSEVFGVYG
jgi:Uma2 family endonuclease